MSFDAHESLITRPQNWVTLESQCRSSVNLIIDGVYLQTISSPPRRHHHPDSIPDLKAWRMANIRRHIPTWLLFGVIYNTTASGVGYHIGREGGGGGDAAKYKHKNVIPFPPVSSSNKEFHILDFETTKKSESQGYSTRLSSHLDQPAPCPPQELDTTHSQATTETYTKHATPYNVFTSPYTFK